MAVVKLQLPVSKEDLLKLHAGDIVLLSGTVVMGRDRAHKYVMEGGKVPFDLKGCCVYHCGPIVKNVKGKWIMVAAGPTTSAREEMYEETFMQRTGVRVVMGKAGMGAMMQQACKKLTGVYLESVGGLAQLHAQRITNVLDVFKLEEFGKPEAMWLCEIKEFPTIVGIDARGVSMYEEVKKKSLKPYQDALKKIG